MITAPSGAGKTTIVKHLLQHFPQLRFSISATTRHRRPNEQDGVDYYFLTPEDFKARVEANAFVEHEEVYPGLHYGTLKSEVERLWDSNYAIVFDVDVEGALHLKGYFQDKSLSLFIKAPSVEIIKQRLQARGTEEETTLQQRIDKAAHEMAYADKFDVVVVNDVLEKALQEAEDLVQLFLSSKGA